MVLLYEINTRVWIFELREKYGSSINLGNIPEIELDEISKYFDWIWFMGIWDHSKIDEKFIEEHPGLINEVEGALDDWQIQDIIGSPYSIKNYKINSIIGDLSDFRNLRERLNKKGVKVMVDFVPNHFGMESRLPLDEPDYFINLEKKPGFEIINLFNKVDTKKGVRWIAHGKDPYFPPWDDTYQVNIFNENLRNYLIKVLKYISSISDGVRCDMSMLLNNEVFDATWGWLNIDKLNALKDEFWNIAIREVKNQNPNFVFLAEVYWDLEVDLLSKGFDYAYEKKLYDNLISKNNNEIFERIMSTKNHIDKMCRFMENHDEDRLSSRMTDLENISAMAIIMTMPGLILIHQGQIEGNKIRVPVQLKRKSKEIAIDKIRFAYEKLFMFHKMIRDGIWIINDVVISNNDDEVNIFSWSWIYDNQVYVIIINNSDKVINSAIEFNFKHDLFNNNRLNYYDHYNSMNSRVSLFNNSINWISKPYEINLLEFNQNIDL